MVSKSVAARIIWFILVVLALASAAKFARNIFKDWQEDHTITSLKTISRSVKELDFPAVTICKDGLNFHAVQKVLQGDSGSGELKGTRKKRQPAVAWAIQETTTTTTTTTTTIGYDEYNCQLKFNRTCEQVSFVKI